MVYIADKTQTNLVYFPKNYSDTETEEYTLKLSNKVDNTSYTYSGLTDEGENEDYYVFSLSFADMEDGEYVYSLSNYSTGLIRIGKLGETKVNYKSNNDGVIYYGEK